MSTPVRRHQTRPRQVDIHGGHLTRLLDIWWPTYKCGGQLACMMANLHIWSPTYIYGGQPSYMVANLNIWWPAHIYGGQLTHMVANLHMWWPTYIYGGQLTRVFLEDIWWPSYIYGVHLTRSFLVGRCTICDFRNSCFVHGGSQESGVIPRGCSITRTMRVVHLWRSSCHAIRGWWG